MQMGRAADNETCDISYVRTTFAGNKRWGLLNLLLVSMEDVLVEHLLGKGS